MKYYSIQTGDGGVRRYTLEDLVEEVEELQLDGAVPQDVHRVFDVAKKLYVFGYYSYEFFTVANHYAFLALEAGVVLKYESMRSPKETRSVSFKRALDLLCSDGIIDEDEKKLLDAGRVIRNSLAHLDDSKLMPPGAGALEQVRKCINKLFKH